MEIPSKQVYEVLKYKGIESIYHANSVITACQFLRSGSLMSRGTVERKGLYQTPQVSDPTDKKKGIWFDIFTDSVDIHDRAKRANFYGPVLFALDLQIIKKSYTGMVWVTKLNPMKWGHKRHNRRYFTSKKDLKDNFLYGQFDHMIVFRHCGGELPFKKYLRKIILDDPSIESRSGIDYYSMAYGAIRLAMTDGGINAKITKRECRSSCRCRSDYETKRRRAKELFLPGI